MAKEKDPQGVFAGLSFTIPIQPSNMHGEHNVETTYQGDRSQEFSSPTPNGNISHEIQRDAMLAALEHMDPAQLQYQVVGLYRHGMMTASWCFARLKQAELIGDIDDVIQGYMIGLAYMQEEREYHERKNQRTSSEERSDTEIPAPISLSDTYEVLATARIARENCA